MAEEAKQDDDDLSIEEILSSIRDIISDEDEEAAEEAPAVDAEEEKETPEEKVLEQEDKEEPKEEVVQAEIKPEPKVEEEVVEEAPAEEEDEVLELGDPIEETAEEAPAEEEEEIVPEIELRDMDEKEETVENVSQPVEDSVREELISATTASASLEAMSKLVAEEVARPDSSSTIEQITKDLLRPMLKDWLDANLPALIEKLVQKELRRLSLKSLDE